jgi:hypothetical protein
MRKLFYFLPLILPAACGSADKGPPAPPTDQTMERHEAAGRVAISLDRPAEAALQYQAALKQAEARDDLAAIGDLSFNLAVAQLQANQPEEALATTRRASAELIRRGSAPFPALRLAQATALYRLDERDDAKQLAAEIEQVQDIDTAAGASFLLGLIAAEEGDEAGLRAALAKFSGATTVLRQADRFELQARLALMGGDLAAARSDSLRSAEIRQEILDYRGMARVLSVAGEAAARAGEDEAAAGLYLRAGRSAAAQSDVRAARPWLEQALKLTADPATREEVQLELQGLGGS